jgi:hypothetical protein
VVTVSDLQARLAQLEPSTTVALYVLRGGREHEVSVDLGVVTMAVPENGRRQSAGLEALIPERLSPR